MRKIFKKIKELQRNNLYYVFFGAQILCIIVYMVSIKGLEKPAGLIEAIKFSFVSPANYLASITAGILAWFLFSVLLTSNFMEIPIIKDLLEYDDYNGCYGSYGTYEDVPTGKMVLNITLCIIAFILNIVFLSYLLSLLGLLVGLIILVFIFSQ